MSRDTGIRETIALAARAANAIAIVVRAAVQQDGAEKREGLVGEDFLAVVSHKLRTPLSSMFMHAQRLRLGAMDEGEVARTAAAIERAARVQKKLLDDLVDVSRIISGKVSLCATQCDLRAVAKAALQGVQAQIEAKSIDLRASLGEEASTVWGDPSRLQQIVSNLLHNAIRFTPERGTITLVVEDTDSGRRLSVSDTGIGIEPEALPRIFGRFSQHSASIGSGGVGLGLGLAIVRRLMQLHDGTVEAKSAGAGEGATFSIQFPRVAVT